MNYNERDIKSTAKLYKCRDSAKFLFGDKYLEKIEAYKSVLEQVKKSTGKGTLPAALLICKSEPYAEDGMSQMLFLAAAVEIIEPSKANTQ